MKRTAQKLRAASVQRLAPLPRPVRVNTLRSAKRLLSRLITQLQAGTIEGREAKDMCYLLSTFIVLVRDFDLEERVKKIEETMTKGVR